jgi:nicotinamidase-related amidase
MKPALLVIDVQKQFFKDDPDTAKSLNSAVDYINSAIHLFREQKLPIVFIQHKNEGDGLVPGTEGFDLPDFFEVLHGDMRFTKTYGNAFNRTGLAEQLKDLGVDTIILTGYCAEYCVLATYRGAKDIDLNPILLLGSLASNVKENIRFVESISQVVSFGALEIFIKALPAVQDIGKGTG